MPSGEPLVNMYDLGGHRLPGETLRRDVSAVAHTSSEPGVAQDLGDGFRMSVRLIPWNEKSGFAILDGENQTSSLRCNNRGAAGHCFNGNEPERFVSGRHTHHVGRGVELR